MTEYYKDIEAVEVEVFLTVKDKSVLDHKVRHSLQVHLHNLFDMTFGVYDGVTKRKFKIVVVKNESELWK